MENWLKKSKKILIILGLVVLAFIILDFNYLRYSVTDYLNNPQPAQQGSVAVKTLEPNFLEIKSLNLKVPIVFVDKNDETTFQAALKNGVVHYFGTANPGEFGNAYIFGHSSDYIWSKGKYKTVFAPLPKIQIGAEILITDKAGNLYTYIVTKTFVASPSDVSLLGQGDKTKKILTLQTSYPLGTAFKRYIVQAELK